jgi:hypothetical protein
LDQPAPIQPRRKDPRIRARVFCSDPRGKKLNKQKKLKKLELTQISDAITMEEKGRETWAGKKTDRIWFGKPDRGLQLLAAAFIRCTQEFPQARKSNDEANTK